jgi:formate hydrogenlyase subunit 6/NADH:ubiquinone oxidoreductase subunit I
MLNLFRPGARGGIVTTTYPDDAEPAPFAYRGQFLLLTDRCIGDGACARVCPSGAITVTGTPTEGWLWQLDDARCVFCGLCAEACPADAVLISHEFELAARDRTDLIAQVCFPARPALAATKEGS